MKLYVREIKPYIKPPCLQGFNGSPYPVEGYDWVSEDLEDKLRNEIVVSDSWSELVFKERYIMISDGLISEFKSVAIGDISYAIAYSTPRVVYVRVFQIQIIDNNTYIWIENIEDTTDFWKLAEDDYIKWANFSTKEEAEKKLEELK